MFRSSIKVFIAFLSISNIYAQTKFEPGYIVPSSGDTIRGMIEYRNSSQNPESILFKENDRQKTRLLGLNDISAFMVHGEFYERAVVSRNTTLINDTNLSENSFPTMLTDTAFLLKFADGPKSLYYLKDHTNKVQLYIGDEHELLIQHKYKVVKDNQTKVVIMDRYRQQVRAYLNCPAIDNQIINLNYSSKDVLRIFESYYKKCSTAKPNAITKREGFKVEIGALAGVTFSKLSFSGYNFPYLIERTHKVSIRPTAGLFLNLVIPRTRRSLLLANELMYGSYKISDHFRTDVNPENYTTTDYTLAVSHIKLNNMVRYRIIRHNAFFYANVGISNAFMISEDNRFLARTQFYTDVHIKEDKALNTRKHDQGFIVGIGAGMRRLGFEVRFENNNGNSEYFSVSSNIKRFSLIAHYRF